MSNILKLLKKKKLKIKLTEEKAHNPFIKAKEKDDRKLSYWRMIENGYQKTKSNNNCIN
ncbi:hypothetical protein BDCR2A_01383 [Borrelia duttonii CR2A]|uniref:Uncharacterized protein n=1 Tax=Borrelia duttonii CR2A TaxID=1432657 RepID=W6TH04_9SPIR|nr:hypothetical protein [Borrelia duttonii]ETZ17683.1 hypothetical protein BDCR2A_01383 [Borrelia duttonii CR2A]